MDLLWRMTDLDKSGSLTREEYMVLHVMLQLNLLADFREQEAKEVRGATGSRRGGACVTHSLTMRVGSSTCNARGRVQPVAWIPSRSLQASLTCLAFLC